MKIREKEVALLWRTGLFRSFRDDAGRSIEVLCPGRHSTRAGCDFQDAVLEIDGARVCGDVEIHVSSDLWYRHGHHRNPACNNVILHVALKSQGTLPSVLENGRTVPTVIFNISPVQIGSLLSAGMALTVPRCQYAAAFSREELGRVLMLEGLERLWRKANAFYGSLRSEPPEDVLFKGICRALGYSRNQAPFERLCGLLAHCEYPRSQGFIMGMAGLLPSQRQDTPLYCGDGMEDLLEEEWREAGREKIAMHRQEWSFAFIRPVNNPVRRVAALCGLLQRHHPVGWLKLLSKMIRKVDPGRPAELEECLVIKDDGYWANHYDFALKMRSSAALLGKGRAREMVVNVILPFFLAYQRLRLRSKHSNMVSALYCLYPAPADNEISVYMKQLLDIHNRVEINGCCQQGLLGIYHRYCRARECGGCPLFTRQRPGWG